MAVEVIDRTRSGWIEAPVVELVEAVLEAEAAVGRVTVAFVDEAAIADLNGRYRGLRESTDALSFRYADDDAGWPEHPEVAHGGAQDGLPGEAVADLGEVVICPAVVRRYAGEADGDPRDQMGWTLIHGVLHLLGYDHERDDGEMRSREQELLAALEDLVRALPPL